MRVIESKKRYRFNHIPVVVLCGFVFYVRISYPFALSLVAVLVLSWQNYIMAMLDIGFLLIFISHHMHLSIHSPQSKIHDKYVRDSILYVFIHPLFSIWFIFTFFFAVRRRIISDYIWYDIVTVWFLLGLCILMWLCMYQISTRVIFLLPRPSRM